jgi:hypothetical protein
MIPKKRNGERIAWTNEIDDIIRECYGKCTYPVVELKKHPITRHIRSDTLKRRAYKLGLRIRCARRYTVEEEQIIIKLSTSKTPNQISRILIKSGKGRTPGAIESFLNERRLYIRPDFYSISDLIIALKCSARLLKRWIDLGLLPAYRDEGQNTKWRILPIHVAQFIYRHPFKLESCRPDIPWLVALLMEYKNRVQIDYRDRNLHKKREEIDEDETFG